MNGFIFTLSSTAIMGSRVMSNKNFNIKKIHIYLKTKLLDTRVYTVMPYN